MSARGAGTRSAVSLRASICKGSVVDDVRGSSGAHGTLQGRGEHDGGAIWEGRREESVGIIQKKRRERVAEQSTSREQWDDV